MTGARSLQEKLDRVWPYLDERARRLFAVSEARQLGHGGVSIVSRACGLSRVTITKGQSVASQRFSEENELNGLEIRG